jgi:predicted ATPase/DNA-binding CsgD family transcriptional regulator/transcriptional regulator with XRE-family HTH domain
MDVAPHFGELLRVARRAAGFTQEALAERAGVSTRTIIDLERGANRAPQRSTLELLAEALALPASERAQWEQLRQRFSLRSAAVPAPRATGSSIPRQHTALVGRQHDVTAITALLISSAVSLLTLTGPGGVGKTRLALAAAQAVADAFPDGCWFVDLTALRDDTALLTTIAQALHVQTAGVTALHEDMVVALRDSTALLVLDNLEQIVDGAPALATLLAGCPRLTILATSRVPLRLRAERQYQVAPLAVPVATDATLELIAQTAAVQLFVECARALMPTFSLSPANVAAVAELCQRLDGLPLAIELATAQLQVLSVASLRDRLDDRLRLLSHGARDAPARQQTMYATIAWSYDLLPGQAQPLFRQLSVFRGGWTLEAAEALAVAGCDVLDILHSLINHSLVRVQFQPDGTQRFNFLETIREFAAAQLRQAGETDDARARHAQYCLQLARQAYPALQTWDITPIEPELDNLRSALAWSLETDQAVIGAEIAGILEQFWGLTGIEHEGAGWMTRLLRDPTLADRLRARLLIALSYLIARRSPPGEVEAHLHEALTLGRQLGDHDLVASALHRLGYIAIEGRQPDPAAARARFRTALAYAEAHAVTFVEYACLHDLGVLEVRIGNYDQAALLLRRLQRLAAAQGLVGMSLYVATRLGVVAHLRGDSAAALQAVEHALDLDPTGRYRPNAISTLELLGMQLDALGHTTTALRLYAAAAAERTRGVVIKTSTLLPIESARRMARERLAATEADTAWQIGARWSLPEAMAAAREAIAMARSTNATAADAAAQPAPAANHPQLTPRERDVLRLVADGLPDGDVAERLSVSQRTVSSHLTAIYTKLGVATRAAAARVALEDDLL